MIRHESVAIGGHHARTARTVDWLTPPAIIEALGGHQSFDLDPCASDRQPWPTAKAHYKRGDNGLASPWHGRVYLNPPYSTDELRRWLGRMAAHNHGTALIFARTETDAFFQYVWDRAAAVLFVRGRLNFHHPDGRRAHRNSGAPSVLIAYGDRDAAALHGSGIAGQFIPLHPLHEAGAQLL